MNVFSSEWKNYLYKLHVFRQTPEAYFCLLIYIFMETVSEDSWSIRMLRD